MPADLRILDAALTCLGRVGLAKTTLDDVAREAGCARATVYRYFPNKQQLLNALIGHKATRLGERLRDRVDAAENLGDAAAAAVCGAAHELSQHHALMFVATHEPEQLLPHLAFEREDVVLHAAAALVAPAFERFLPAPEALRLGEWLARITLSYLCSPSEHLDVFDIAQVRVLVDDFVLPGFSKPATSEGAPR